MSYHHPQAPPHYPPASSHYPPQPGAPAAGPPQQHLGDPGPHPSSPDSPTTSSSRKRARPADMDALGAAEDTAGYKDYYGAQPGSAQGYYDTSGGAPPQAGGSDLGAQVGSDNGGFAIEHGDGEGDDDDDDETPRRASTSDATKAGRRKIKIEFIQDKSRRHITFSKRKAGIMKKAYELSTLTGTQVLLLVVSETGLVYTFTTAKLQPLVTQPEGKNLIQACLNAPTGGGSNGGPSSGPSGPGGPPGSGAAGGSSGRQGGGGRNNVGGINIGGGGGADGGVGGHGGPAGHQHAAGGPPPLESSEAPGALDSGSSPTTPFHGGYGGSQYAGGRSMTASSTTAASNSSPALTHAPSPNLGGDGKRARRRTEIAQKDVSMGVPVGGPPGLRRATLPSSTADAAAALEAEAGTMPNGLPAAATPEYVGEHPTPPTGAPPMSRNYSSSGQGEAGTDSPGPMYHAAPGNGDAWSGHYPHDVGHHGHHQAPYGHGMPAHPPMPMQTAVVQQGWGDFGGRR